MAFKRKRPRVVWLPQDINDRYTTAPITNGNQNAPGYVSVPYTSGFGNRTDLVVPLVHDATPSYALTDGLDGLADLYSSAYRLRRIVGSIFVTHAQTAVGAGPFPDNPTGALVSVGLIVLRINPQDYTPLSTASEYSNLSLQNTSDPWIWRRSWVLADTNLWVANGFGNEIGGWLRSNTEYGDIRSGSHVDAKTARVISLEERLFMVISIIARDGDAAGGSNAYVDFTWDLRFLASLRSNVGNRNNSSR